jgi:hypothetical protein
MSRHLEEDMSNPTFLNECITDTKLVFALCEALNLTQKKIALPSHEAKFTVIATLKLTFL